MPNRLFRLIKVIWTLGRYDVILPREFHAAIPPSAKFFGAILRLGANKKGDVGQRMKNALTQLGAVWIKFGQILATRPDLIGTDLTSALSGLKDNVPPFDNEIARQIVIQELFEGDENLLKQAFGDIGQVIAAASVAQVYKIQDKNGKLHALKILRPNVEVQIAKDLEALALGAKIAQFIFPKSRRLNPTQLVETVKHALEIETDLRREAGACDAFSQICAIDGYYEVPKISWEYSTKKIMVSDWIDGIPLTEPRALEKLNKTEAAMNINRGFLSAALEQGFFHADMHEGNIIIGNDGKIYLVDFGIMGLLKHEQQRYLAEILYSFIKRDYRRAARVHFEAGYVPKDKDEGEFGIALRAVCEPIWGRKASEVSMGRVLMQLFDVTEQFGMKLRPELVLLQKTMVQVEGVARNIHPDHDIWEAAEPIVEKFMRRELGPEGIIKKSLENFEKFNHSMQRLPNLLDRLEKFLDEQK